MAVRGLNTFDEQRQLLSSIPRLRSNVREPATCVEALEYQVAATSVEPASARGDMTPIEESVAVAWSQLADAQLALPTAEGEGDEYCRRLGTEKQRYGGSVALHFSLHTHFVDHTSLVGSTGLPLSGMDRDFEIYSLAIFADERHCTVLSSF